VNRTLNALSKGERHVRNPVDTVTTEIHGGSFQSRPFRNREELNRTLEVYPFTFAPFPNQPVHGFKPNCAFLRPSLPPCELVPDRIRRAAWARQFSPSEPILAGVTPQDASQKPNRACGEDLMVRE